MYHACKTSLVALLVLLLVLCPCWSHRSEAFFGLGNFGIKDEKELGDKFNVLVRSKLPLIEDPEITGYVGEMIGKIKEAMPPQPFEITHGVVRHSSLNAFAAPAGYVFIYSGLILKMDSESQMAGVMAHELAHVSQRHIASRIEAMGATNLLSLIGMLAGAFLGGKYSQGIMVGTQAAKHQALLNYSREHEQEADEVGLGYLIDAGYRPHGLHESFEIMLRNKWIGGAGGQIPTYLSTHPALSERIGYISQNITRLPQEIQDRTDDNTRFRRIQTLLRARYTDPKNALSYFQRIESPTPCLDALGRGIALTRTNQFQAAEAAFQEGLLCSGDDSLFLRELGRLRFQQGDFHMATTLLQRAVAKNRQDLMAHFYLGRIMGDTGQIQPAMDSFQRILRQLPEDPEVHEAYGRALGQSGRYFEGHLHLAWAAFYRQDEKRTEFHTEKAEGLASTPEQKEEIEKLKTKQEEREELLNPSLF